MTQEDVAKLFVYKDGGLYWNIRGKKIKFGSRAGSLGADGYRRIKHRNRYYMEHRLIFLLHHGYLPHLLDHIDGDPTNNRVENLRSCNYAENNRNSRHTSTSGVKGVTWDSSRNKWRCQIHVDSKNYNLGRYDTLEEATKVINTARAELHGVFANYQTKE